MIRLCQAADKYDRLAVGMISIFIYSNFAQKTSQYSDSENEVFFMVKTLYTIGYSCFKINDFINIIKKYKIDSVIDVRSNPNSKFYVDYNRENIENILKKNKIFYRNYAKEFGARQEDSRYYTDGYLDFKKFAQSKIFLTGEEKLIKSMERDYTFVLMCAEKDPATCHRNIMIARNFYKKGYEIGNIIDNGNIETQENIEKRLLDCYFPDRDQISFFDISLSKEEMIDEAYQLRNKEIGFKMENIKEQWGRYE